MIIRNEGDVSSSSVVFGDWGASWEASSLSSSLFFSSPNMRMVNKMMAKAFMASDDTSKSKDSSSEMLKYVPMFLMQLIEPKRIMLKVVA